MDARAHTPFPAGRRRGASGAGFATGSPAAARPNGFVTAHLLGEDAEAMVGS
ncbi:hypothetical protein [Kutzneria sp. NPDC051319]|uniref:hypothetical protein n=1 Tax=Kutzneria sp. NPDC051319 TaxID=3155047 RepID=UPI0034252582